MHRLSLLAAIATLFALLAMVGYLPIPGTSLADPGETPDESASADADDDSLMIRVKNSLYNEKDPLLFDSGYAEDNSSCQVCHADFEHEKISSVHEEGGITCAACHGDSLTHSGDEFNISRPDVIWGRAEIEPFCKQCHLKHKKPEEVAKFRAEWEDKRRPNGRFVLADSVCTDCHGKHAIITEDGNFK
ncbi:MAG: cytochrome c3 family protein [Planctomycetes bacterium]|nr:cytochrome c3 family protein [Planctomycetota bacterium]